MKFQRNSLHKPLWATFLMLTIVIFMGISCVSAADLSFDNYKEVSPDATLITYKDSGFGEDTILAEFELNTPHLFQIGLGYQKVLEYEVRNSFESVDNMIGSIDVYNINEDMKKEEVKIDLKYQTTEEYEVEDWDYSMCDKLDYEEKALCKEKEGRLLGTHNETRNIWVDYTPKTILKDEVITISGWTNVKQGDSYEWIQDFYDGELRIEEWATWAGNLSTAITSYWNFDEQDSGSGTIIDSLNLNNGTNNGATNITGKIKTGYDFEADTTDYMLMPDTNSLDMTDADFSINLWMKIETNKNYNPIIAKRNGGQAYQITSQDIGYIELAQNDGASDTYQDTSADLQTGQWYMITWTVDIDGDVSLYINGTLNYNTACLNNFGDNGEDFLIGRDGESGTYFYDGAMDELGIWRRTLTSADVKALYNNFTGCSYGNESCFTSPIVAPTITLNSPVDTANLTNPNVEFNCTATADGTLANVSLIINGIYNITNATVTSGVPVLNTVLLADGDYNWTCGGCDENSCDNATGRTFSINTSVSVEVTLIDPVDTTNSSIEVDDFTFNITENNASTWCNYTFTIWNSTDDIVRENVVINGTIDADCFISHDYDGVTKMECTGQDLDISDTYDWNVYACVKTAFNSDCQWASSNFTFEIDATLPTIIINSGNGTQNYGDLGINHTINFTVTDTNLDTCIIEYNGANTTIAGCVTGIYNTTDFTLVQGVYNATIYVNDTFGNQDSQFFSWDYRILELTDAFVTPVLEGTTNNFLINVTTNSSIATGYLYYNGTAYIGSVSSSGGVYTIQRDHTALQVATSTNISFYWNLTTADGFNYAMTAQNQTDNPIEITNNCTSRYVIYNFTIVDEITQAKLNGSANVTIIKMDAHLYTIDRAVEVFSYYTEYSSTNPATICIDNNLSTGSTYLLDLQVQYSATNYATEMYHLENETLNEDSIGDNITLYDLASSDAQEFKLLTRDTTYLPLEGALIQIDRKYIENGTFQTIEIPKTDGNGIATASLQLNDVIYNFYIYQSGVLVSSFTNVNAICQTPTISTCEIDFNAFASGVTVYDYEEGDDLDFTLGYNDTSRVVSSVFTIPSGTPGTIRLTVNKEDALGTSVCTDTLTSASGTLSCVVPSSFGNSTVMAYLYKDDVEQGKGNLKLDEDSSDIYGGSLIFLSLMVFITLIGIGMSDNPIVTVVFLMVGVMIMMAMNLIQNTGFIGATATFLFFAIAGVLILIKAARRN